MTTPVTLSIARRFNADETVRWSCRCGEFVLWVGAGSVLTSDRRFEWRICDSWQMQNGDFVTITNRVADLPVWFELHPLEVAGSAVLPMKKRLDAGYEPDEIMDAPNFWRVKAGDRLVWAAPRDLNVVRAILTLTTCVLVIAENAMPSSDAKTLFRAPQGTELPKEDAAAMREGFDAAVALDIPREFAEEWRFGA